LGQQMARSSRKWVQTNNYKFHVFHLVHFHTSTPAYLPDPLSSSPEGLVQRLPHIQAFSAAVFAFCNTKALGKPSKPKMDTDVGWTYGGAAHSGKSQVDKLPIATMDHGIRQCWRRCSGSESHPTAIWKSEATPPYVHPTSSCM